MAELVDRIKRFAPSAIRFAEPATLEEIHEVEKGLGSLIRSPLKELLLETNGISGETSETLIWTVDEILRQNILFRSDFDFPELYMPFDPLLFFGDDGGSHQYAMLSEIDKRVVFAWDHETDSRFFFANDPIDFLDRYFNMGPF